LRAIYTAFLYLLVPFVVLRLLWRGVRAPDYWRRWPERFGFAIKPQSSPTLWIHAVSVGEAIAAFPLVSALRERYTDLGVVITTTTPTGAARVRAQYGEGVSQYYLPYDLPGAVRRFLTRTRPVVAIIMETELWPNLFHYCRQRQVPVVIANARLSERSARRYRRLGRLTRATIAEVERFAAQTVDDGERLRLLGARAQQVQITGNIKFDIELPADLRERAATLRACWGSERPVWIAASTHAGEDELVLEAHRQARATHPDLLLVLVPRHPERFERVAALCRSRGLRLARRTTEDCNRETEVYLGDTMGELRMLIAAADLAFVGGSLVPVGGHNVLEPAALGVPVLFGPHMFNFTEAAHLLLEADAAIKVDTWQELAQAIGVYLRNTDRRKAAGTNGLRVVEQNRGALRRQLDLIAELLDTRGRQTTK